MGPAPQGLAHGRAAGVQAPVAWVLIGATCALSLLERSVPEREVYFRLLTQTRANTAIFGCCGEKRAKARLAAGADWI